MLTFHPGNPRAVPCDFLPSNTDTLHWPGDLGTGFHLNDKDTELDGSAKNEIPMDVLFTRHHY